MKFYKLKSLKIGALILTLIGVGLLVFVWYISYDVFLDLIPKVVEVESDKNGLSKIITTQHFFFVRAGVSFLPIMGLMLFLGAEWLDKVLSETLTFSLDLKKDLPVSVLAGIFIGVNLIIRLFYASETPILFDEAWTYLNFTQKGIPISLTIYPLPNNHVLHSVLTNLSYYLPFEPTLNLRLPSLIVGTFSTFFLFVFFGKLLDKKTSLLLIILYASLTPVLLYNFLARGYSFVLLFFIICFFATVRLIQEHESKSTIKYYIYLSIGGIMGIFTMPSFLYPFFSLNSFLFLFFLKKKHYSGLKTLIVSGVISGIIVLFLYSPIIAISGAEVLYNNRFVAPIQRIDVINELFFHFSSVSKYLFDIKGLLFLILSIGGTIFLFLRRKNQKELILLGLYCLIISPVLLTIHSVLPFYRTWIYLVIPVLWLLGLIINLFKIPSKVFASLLIIVCFYHIQSLGDLKPTILKDFRENPYQVKEVFHYIKPNAIHCHHIEINPLYYTCLKYYEQVNNLHMEISSSKSNISNYKDTLKDKTADYILMDGNVDNFGEYELDTVFHSNHFLYKRTPNLKLD